MYRRREISYYSVALQPTVRNVGKKHLSLNVKTVELYFVNRFLINGRSRVVPVKIIFVDSVIRPILQHAPPITIKKKP